MGSLIDLIPGGRKLRALNRLRKIKKIRKGIRKPSLSSTIKGKPWGVVQPTAKTTPVTKTATKGLSRFSPKALTTGVKNIAPKAMNLGKGFAGKAGPIAMAVLAVYDGIKGAMKDDEIKQMFDKEGEDAKILAKERFGAGIGSAIDGLLLGLLPDDIKRRVSVFASEVGAGVASTPAGNVQGLNKGVMEGLVKSTDAYREALKGTTHEMWKQNDAIAVGTKEQYAFNEGLFKGKFVGVSLNDMADGLDRLLTSMEMSRDKIAKQMGEWKNAASEVVNEWKGKIKGWFSSTKKEAKQTWQSIKDFFSQGISQMWENVKTKAKELWEKIKDMFKPENIKGMIKGIFMSAKNYIINAVKNAMTSMSDGMLRMMWRVIQMVQGIYNFIADKMPGMDKVEWGQDFSRYANKIMHTRYKSEVRDLEERVRKARAEGRDVFNPQIASFKQELEDLESRRINQAEFIQAYAEEDHKFTPYQLQVNANLERIAKASESGAGAGHETAKNTERIARNTERPKKFIDIDSLAIRANESRNVYMTYQTVPEGNT